MYFVFGSTTVLYDTAQSLESMSKSIDFKSMYFLHFQKSQEKITSGLGKDLVAHTALLDREFKINASAYLMRSTSLLGRIR